MVEQAPYSPAKGTPAGAWCNYWRCTGPAGPREGKLHLLFGNARFAQAMAGAALLQHAFGLLPAGAALSIKARILHQLIKALCQRAFALFLPPTAAQAASTGGCGNITVSPLRIGITGNPLSGLFGLSVPQRGKNMRRAAKAAPCAMILGSKLIHRPIHQPPHPGSQCAERQHRARDGKNFSANARYPAFGLELHRRADH